MNPKPQEEKKIFAHTGNRTRVVRLEGEYVTTTPHRIPYALLAGNFWCSGNTLGRKTKDWGSISVVWYWFPSLMGIYNMTLSRSVIVLF